MTGPFRHHPNLANLIIDPDVSNWRHVTSAKIISQLAESGLAVDWFLSDEDRETLRLDAMDHHDPETDLWVFAYGSLMWDPALHFTDVRRAHLTGHARRFILFDQRGWRGNAGAPGLMAALDVTGPQGPGCDGLAFRIAADRIETETRVLFQREMIANGYHARFVTAQIDTGPINVLTFVADHDSDLMEAGLTRDQQIHYIATGTGILGSSYDYICNLATQLKSLNVHDDDVMALLADVDAYRAG